MDGGRGARRDRGKAVAYEAGEGELEEEKIGAGLVASNFAEGDCAWSVATCSRVGDGIACCEGVSFGSSRGGEW